LYVSLDGGGVAITVLREWGYVIQEAKESFASPDYLFYGKSHIVNQLIVRMAAKSPFCLPSILLPKAMDKSGTPLRLMLRPPSFFQCPICQVLSSGLDGTWQQPKGVECGISKIANYNSTRGHGKLCLSR